MSAGGSNGTRRPAHTSWACRINSRPPRGTKSAAGALCGLGRLFMNARAPGSAAITTEHRIRDAVSNPSTSRCGVASGPIVKMPQCMLTPRSSSLDAKLNAGANSVSIAWSAVRVQLHSSVPAGTDQSRSAPRRQASATTSVSAARSPGENTTSDTAESIAPNRRRHRRRRPRECGDSKSAHRRALIGDLFGSGRAGGCPRTLADPTPPR